MPYADYRPMEKGPHGVPCFILGRVGGSGLGLQSAQGALGFGFEEVDSV